MYGRIGGCVVVLAALVSLASVSMEFHSIGIRFLIPTVESPFAVGLEAAISVEPVLATGSFFLTSNGEALITASVDIPVGEASASGLGSAYLRLTTGVCYIETTDPLPTPIFGGGIAWRLRALSEVGVGMAAEFSYPLAFPVPMLSVSAGWWP